MRKTDIRDHLIKLIDIGISLSSKQDLNVLLDSIVREARSFTNSDAGSLYVREGDDLRFVVSQCDTLAEKEASATKNPYLGKSVPISHDSLAGHVALTGETLNIADAYALPPDLGFEINKDFDRQNDYRTKSMMITPLRVPNGDIIGVLQLINAMDRSDAVLPFSPVHESLVQSLASQAAVAINNVQLTQQLKQSYLDTIIRLAVAVEYRDKETSSHIQRISKYSEILAKGFGLSDEMIETIKYASPMHDIGKLGVPDAILQKPGKLTSQERKKMEAHTLMGAKILENSDSPVIVSSHSIALSHHEKYDGTGYPHNLKGNDIPLEGRIVALADVFDALASARCYKEACKMEDVLDVIKSEKGKHFDSECVDVFFTHLDEIIAVHNKHNIV